MSGPLLQRFEIKYVISEALVGDIRAHLAPYMRLDPFSSRREDGNYPVSSLYLDTRDRSCARETRDGIKTRFKMRVRAYDDAPGSRIFCEVKHRDGDVIRKSRVGLPRDTALRSAAGPDPRLTSEADRLTLSDFRARIARWGMRPTTVIRYDREAYESVVDAPVRVTFDRRLRRLAADGWGVPVHRPDWTPVGWSRDPEALVLELKYDGRPPRWVAQMIRALELRQTGFGKYVTASDEEVEALERRRAGAAWTS